MKIEVIDVSKNFKKINVLNHINLTFHTGKVYGLIGRNGSGKSVFLKILCGLYEPSSGDIWIDGKSIFKNKAFLPNTRAMIEKANFLPELSGFENLKLLSSIQNKIDDERIIEVLKTVNLVSEKDKKFKEYSLGMKQKLNIAQVLMENPDIMIFDEPFNGIDAKSIDQIKEAILADKPNKIIFVTSHVKNDLISMSDELLLCENGHIEKTSIKDLERY